MLRRFRHQDYETTIKSSGTTEFLHSFLFISIKTVKSTNMGCGPSKLGSEEGMAANKVEDKADNQVNMVTNTVENDVQLEDIDESIKDDFSQAQLEVGRKASNVENGLNEETNAEINLEKTENNINRIVDTAEDDIETQTDQQVNDTQSTVKDKTDAIENNVDNKVNSLTSVTNSDQNKKDTTNKRLRDAKIMEVTVVDTGTDDLANKVGKKRKGIKPQDVIEDEDKSLNDSMNNDENVIDHNNDSANTEVDIPNGAEVDNTE